MYYFCSLESEKKKATKIIFGSRLNIKKKDGKGKRVTTAIMLYENEKLDEEDVLETFHQSEVKTFVNLIFMWTIFGQNFVADEQPTSFQPALHITDNSACGLRPSKQTRARFRSPSWILSSLILLLPLVPKTMRPTNNILKLFPLHTLLI